MWVYNRNGLIHTGVTQYRMHTHTCIGFISYYNTIHSIRTKEIRVVCSCSLWLHRMCGFNNRNTYSVVREL